jgi:hypothetical protein
LSGFFIAHSVNGSLPFAAIDYVVPPALPTINHLVNRCGYGGKQLAPTIIQNPHDCRAHL